MFYQLPILIVLQNFHKVFLFVVPAKIHFKLSRSTINLFANNNFSVFVELENYDTNKSEFTFNFIGDDQSNQYV